MSEREWTEAEIAEEQARFELMLAAVEGRLPDLSDEDEQASS